MQTTKIANQPKNRGQRNRLAWLGFYPLIALLLLACNLSSTVNFVQKLRLTPLPQTSTAAQRPILPVPTLLPIPALVPGTRAGQYQPSAEIIRLMNDAAMTPKAMDLFLSTQPQIDTNRLTFERHCQTQVMRSTVELGCFTSENHIFLLKLDDPRISSEMTVTAAHEMLHVAYTQISTSDRTMIDGLLETAVVGIQDPDLLQRLSAYHTFEPGQHDNELHSILGTEYAPLGGPLDQYFSQYFSDGRLAVVTAAQQFNQIFTNQENQIASLQTQIRQMRRQMQSDLNSHNNEAYNKLVPQINDLIQQYNQAVREYNALSRELLGEESPTSNQ